MDFDDEHITKLHAPQTRTPTPPLPNIPASTTSTPNPTTTPSLPHSTAPKDNETYYIKPIPSGLRAKTLADLMTACHTHTLHHGFDVVKKAGVKPTSQKGGRKTILPNAAYYKWHITCVLGGKPKNTRHLTADSRLRDKGSIKQGCQSRVWAWAVDRNEPEGEWEIRWGDKDPALHNHPPVDVRTLPNHRRRAREGDDVQECLRGIAEEGLGRKEGLKRLRERFPEGLFSEKDVANELQKWRQMKKAEGAEQGEQEEGGNEEEMEGVVGDGVEEQAQLPTQTNNQHSHQQTQPPPPIQTPQQPQHHQPQQQRQHLFAPGVPSYWSATAGHNF
ncbi:hypothetical protein E4T49_07341 [Aureobasidium sp. EXF-10728]|nr:hypothetical protein E4T49_07341 [Aureobasidium sp. EXF-10728]